MGYQKALGIGNQDVWRLYEKQYKFYGKRRRIMRFFDKKAFLMKVNGVDDRYIREDLQDVGIVFTGPVDGARKSFNKFIRFVAQEDNDDKHCRTPESLLFEDLLEISQFLDDIVHALSDNYPNDILDLSNNLRTIKGTGGKRRIL